MRAYHYWQNQPGCYHHSVAATRDMAYVWYYVACTGSARLQGEWIGRYSGCGTDSPTERLHGHSE